MAVKDKSDIRLERNSSPRISKQERNHFGPTSATRVTGAVIIGGHFQGLGIIRSLGEKNVPLCLLDNELCIGRFSRYSKKYYTCPSVRNEKAFLDFLINLAVKDEYFGWVIYPSDDETVNFLAHNKELLGAYYKISTPEWKVTRYASEKKLTYQLAKEYGIPVPKTFVVESIDDIKKLNIEYPVILKPSVKEPFYSLTKKKAIKANSRDELQQEFLKAKAAVPVAELLVQELIPGGPGNLYSVGSFFKNGEIQAKVIARRIRQHPMDFGHATTYAVTIDNPELELLSRRFLRAMGYYGLSEIEYMQDARDGKYKLIEMNARTWGWHTLAMSAGADLPYFLYLDSSGQEFLKQECKCDVKWFHIITDVPTVLDEIRKGKMSLKDYFNSIKGKKSDAVFSFKDPLPFIMEIILAPYLWIRRGF